MRGWTGLRWTALGVMLLACRGAAEKPVSKPDRAKAERADVGRSEAEREALKADPDAPKLGEGRWFVLSAFIPSSAPRTDKFGRPVKGPREDRGGEAVGVLDANGDGRQDVIVANGSDYFVLALNEADPTRGVRFKAESLLDGEPDDGVSGRAKGIGLHDLNNDGFMDVWLANQGKGGIITYKRDPPNDKGLYRSAAMSTWLNNKGRLHHVDLGIDGAGSKRLALFDDFDGDGFFDAYISGSSYYGIWYAGGTEPNQLFPGRQGGFGPDALDAAFDGPMEGLWTDAQGRSVKNFKGAIVRDLDGDGRGDIIAGSIADLWANYQLDLCDPAEEGYQGTWDRGLFVFHNLSEPGRLRFRDVSHEATAVSYGHEGEGHVHSVLALDIDHDGDLDVVASGNKGMLSHGTLEHDSPVIRVLRNDSTPGRIVLVDVTEASGLGFMNTRDKLPPPYPITATEFDVTQTLFPAMMAGVSVDVDNDGHVDLVMVDRQTFSEDPESGQPYGLGAWLFKGDGKGGFRYVADEEHGIRGTARDVSIGDFDVDGRMDLVFVDGSTGGQYVSDDNRVWLNRTGEGNHWAWITVDEPANRFGIGARVRLRAGGAVIGHDEIRTDFSYRSKRDAVAHFGLGAVGTFDLELTLRDGVVASWAGLAADRRYRVVRATAGSGGVVTGGERLDISHIDLATLRQGGAAVSAQVRDADGDGRPDLALGTVPGKGPVVGAGSGGLLLVVDP